MDATLRVVVAAVDLGMLLVAIPGLALDRTGVAQLGAISPSLPPPPGSGSGRDGALRVPFAERTGCGQRGLLAFLRYPFELRP